MTISPSLAGLPVLTPTTGDELAVHALVHAVMPSEQRATRRTTTPSASKISAPQTHEEHAHGPSCGEQPSARPSPDTATTTATIARGPPLHNDGNDKAPGINQSFVRVYQFSMSETRENRVVRRGVPLCLIIAYLSRHTIRHATEHP